MTDDISTLVIQGQVWFRARDIVHALGIDLTNAVDRLRVIQEFRGQYVRYVRVQGRHVSYISEDAYFMLVNNVI